MANNQSHLNSIQIVFGADGHSTGSTEPMAVRIPRGQGNDNELGVMVAVGAGGSGNITSQIEGRCVSRTGAKTAWIDLGNLTATGASSATIKMLNLGPCDEFRVTVNGAHSGGSGGTFDVYLLVGNNSVI